MIIINQDRDKLYYIQKNTNLDIIEDVYNNKIIGYNVVIDQESIGTFDTLFEAIIELNNINNCTYNIYVINGFEDYDNCFLKVGD